MSFALHWVQELNNALPGRRRLAVQILEDFQPYLGANPMLRESLDRASRENIPEVQGSIHRFLERWNNIN
ncbi:MAG: hypothetical protein K8R69_00665 [Deltaproteobacteria bacterium]|nr:hypothetical protein [Deltaproteobacteria bacterium]